MIDQPAPISVQSEAPDRNPRPTSVTIVGWLLIVSSVCSCSAVMNAMTNPRVADVLSQSVLPLSFQYFLAWAGLLVTLVSGKGVLDGDNWARLLFVGWSGVSHLISIVTLPVTPLTIPGLVLYLIFAFILFRPAASAYFSRKQRLNTATSP